MIGAMGIYRQESAADAISKHCRVFHCLFALVLRRAVAVISSHGAKMMLGPRGGFEPSTFRLTAK